MATIKFACKKIGRDKGLEGFKAEGVTPHYQILTGDALCQALQHKLIEEAHEVQDTSNRQEVTAELADVLEVVDGLCSAYNISMQDVLKEKERKCQDRGGFQKGLYIDSLEMDESNPKVAHFRKSPDKYPEIKE